MKKIGRREYLGTLVVLAFGFLALPATYAQEARGRISGRIMDSTGAIIQGVSVKVTNVAMGNTLSVISNEEGFFNVPFLSPGNYQVAVEAVGFKRALRDGVVVNVNSNVELSFKLELGEVQETVTVTEDIPVLNTTAATMGQVVDSRRVADLPLAHGNPYALIGLAAGVSWSHTAATLNRPFEPTHIVGFSVNGSRANRMDVTIDGVPSTATANANEVIASYVPPVDIVQEFKVQTAAFDASYGQTESGVTNISLKSGTNQFHGTAFWANQAPSLAANEWGSNRIGAAKAAWDYNRWGGSLGGPVNFGKLYNGKNKTFFMWGYEAIHESRPRNNCGTNCSVPTAAQKNGDFSQLLSTGGASYQIYNPFTRREIGNGIYQQDPFPNNVIPAALISPVSKKILDSYWPSTPFTAGNALGQNNQLDPNLPEAITYYTHSFKVDHALTEAQRLSVTGRFYKRDSNYNNYLGSGATGEWFQFLSRAGGVDYVNTLNSTTVLNVRYGYNRFIRSSDGNPETYGIDLTTLGFPARLNDTSEDIRRFPGLGFTGGYVGTRHDNFFRPIDTHTLGITLSKVKGTHSLKTGIEARAYRENNRTAHSDMTSRFEFDSTWTRGPRSDSATSPNNGFGQSMAAFLLGLPSATNSYISRLASYAEQSTAWGIFLQDDWKVNERLTLNLGLRWEYEGALKERFNRSVRGFDSGYVQPIEQQARANYAANPLPEIPASQFNVRGGYTFAGVNGEPNGLYESPKKNFMPQVGFAFKLTEKTVLRGGYGINYGFLGQRRGDVVQDGFSQNTGLVPSLDNGLSFFETLSNPFTSGVLQPKGSAEGPQTFLGQSIRFFNRKPDQVYNQRWQLALQHELAGGWAVDAAYVGSRGTNIEIDRNLNATPNYYLSSSPVRDQSRITYLSGTVPNPFYGLLPVTTTIGGTRTIAREQLLRPFPQFAAPNATTGVVSTTNQGYSWYHSLQAGIQKRFSKGYTVLANYTYSKFMQATEYLNPADPMPTEVISDMDTPHRLSLSGIYELPWGKTGSGLAQRVLGGWQINANYQIQSGRPVGGAGAGTSFGNLLFTGNFKDILLTGDQRTPDRWFNTDAGFNKVAGQQLDRNVRTFPLRFSFLRVDRVNNVDFSLLKNTKIVEGKELQFRAEFLNALNNANYGVPDMNPTSGNFGRIVGTFNYSRRIQLGLKFIF